MALVFTTKEAILNAVETALKTLSWIKTVDRQHMGIEEYDPKGALLNDLRESRRTVLKNCILVNYTLLLTVYVLDEATAALSTDLNAAIEQVKALFVGSTLGGIAKSVQITSVDTGGGFESPKASATFDLAIVYLSAV